MKHGGESLKDAGSVLGDGWESTNIWRKRFWKFNDDADYADGSDVKRLMFSICEATGVLKMWND